MYSDADGKRFADHGNVVLFDTDVQYDTEEFEEFIDAKLRDLQKSDDIGASEVNIGGGADWPVIAIEVLEHYIPHATIVAVFFSGDRILKNLKAWKQISSSILGIFPKKGFSNREGAAAVLLGRISDNFEGNELRLISYRCFDRIELTFVDIEATHEWIISEMQTAQDIGVDQYKMCHGPPIHAFRIEIDGTNATAIVEGSAVSLYVN